MLLKLKRLFVDTIIEESNSAVNVRKDTHQQFTRTVYDLGCKKCTPSPLDGVKVYSRSIPSPHNLPDTCLHIEDKSKLAQTEDVHNHKPDSDVTNLCTSYGCYMYI